MRPSNNDYGQLASFANYTYSPSKIASSYQKGAGFPVGFNSPKNESQKGISLSTKLSMEANRRTPKTEQPATDIGRRNSKTSQEAASKVGLSSSATFPKNQGVLNSQGYKIAEHRGNSIDKREAASLNSPSSSSKQPIGYVPSVKYNNVQEIIRSELGYTPKSKKLVIDTNLDSSKSTSYDNKSYTTKAQPDQEENLSSKIAKKNNSLNKYAFEAFKLSNSYTPPGRQANQIGFSSKVQTEVDEERHIQLNGPASTKNRQNTLDNKSSSSSFYGMIVPNRGVSRDKEKRIAESEKQQQQAAYNPSRKIGFSTNGQLKYNNLNQGVIKSNNFFSSTGNTWSSVLNNKEKSVQHSNSSVAQKVVRKQEDLTRSATFEARQASKQQDLRASWNVDTSEQLNTPKKDRETGSVDRNVDSFRNSQDEKKTAGKSALEGLITKVNRGDFLGATKKPMVAPEAKPVRSQSKQQHTISIDESHGQTRPASKEQGSRSVKNSETKPLGFGLNKQQHTQEVARPSSKMSKSSVMAVVKSEPVEQQQESPAKKEKKPFIYHVTSLEKHHREYDPSNYFCQIYREHFMQTFQALMFCRFLKPIDQKAINARKVNLPRKEIHKDKKTLIFDLDETLIHCNESTSMPCDVIVPIKFPHGEIIEAGINVRPYAVDILRELSNYFEIMVFTASQSSYANVVIDYLDPKREYVQHRLFREHCTPTEEGVYIKDLRVIGNRNMQDMILVDNAAYSFGYQIENGIPIVPFYDNKTDQELKHLIPYLKFLAQSKDPREINKLTFKLHNYTQHSTPDAILQNVVFQD